MAKAAFVISVVCALVVGCAGSAPGATPTTPGPGSTGAPAPTQMGTQSGAPTAPSSSPVAPLSGASATAAGSWTAGQGQAGSVSNVLACATATFCLAGGGVWDGTSWSALAAEPDTGIPSIIECRSATDCSAISDDQYTVWDGTSWKTSENFYQDGGPQGGVSIDSMSCPTATFCAAADRTYGYVYLFDGKNWTTDKTTVDQAVADATAAVNAGGTGNVVFNTIACASATFCALVDGSGNARTFDGQAWSASESVASKPADGSPALDCASEMFCVAQVGNTVSAWNGSSWQPASDVPPYAAASCPVAGTCVLVGVNGATSDWAVSDGQTAALGSGQTGVEQPWAASCPTADFCMATGPYGWSTWNSS